MNRELTVFYGVFLLGSLSFLVMMVIIIKFIIDRIQVKKPYRSIKYVMLPLTGTALLSILCMRFEVIYYVPEMGGVDCSTFADSQFAHGLNILSTSLVNTMQTFSLDADYASYLKAGTEFIYNSQLIKKELILVAYIIIVTVTNIAAPIFGGAVILNFLCDSFPSLRYNLTYNGRKYIFSKLNERSLVLARSIAEHDRNCGKRYALIFADVYENTSDEKISELCEQAKQMGAFCFSCDIKYFKPYGFMDRILAGLGVRGRELYVLLISNNSDDNIEAVQALTEINANNRIVLCRDAKKYKDTVFFHVFSDTAADQKIVDEINAKYKDTTNILLMLVQEHKNTVLRFLYENPLFLPLECGGYDSLEMMIIGSGNMAVEMICQSYWCGQLLQPQTLEKLPLIIHSIVGSDDELQKMEGLLEHCMPEAFRPDDKLNLRTQIHFHKAAYGTKEFDEWLERYGENISNAIVFLHDMKAARETALTMQRFFEKRELRTKRPVMLYLSVWNEYIGRALENCCERIKKEVNGCCHIKVFGDRRNRFSYDTIFLLLLLRYAVAVNRAHEDEEDFAQMRNLMRDSYKMNSSVASAVHFIYKLYSAGAFENNLHPALNLDEMINALERYNEKVNSSDIKHKRYLLNHLAWLEHMRWNAYMQSIGYSRLLPADWDAIQCDNSSKEFKTESKALRLHNCLCESSPDHGPFGRLDGILSEAEYDQREWGLSEPEEGWDELDRVSWMTHRKALEYYGFTNEDAVERIRSGKREDMQRLFSNYKSYDYKMTKALIKQMNGHLARSKNDSFSLHQMMDSLSSED